MKYTLLSMSHRNFSDVHWQKTYQMLVSLRKQKKSLLSAVSWQEYKNDLISFMASDELYRTAAILKGDEHVALMRFYGRNVGTTHQTCALMFDIDLESIPDEISIMVAKQIAEWMGEHSYQSLFYVSHEKQCADMVRNWGAEEYSHQNRYVLERAEANLPVIYEWLETIPAEQPDLRLLCEEEVPDKYLEEYAHLLTAGIREMPQERDIDIPFQVTADELRKRAEWRSHTTHAHFHNLIVDRQDKLVGLTFVALNRVNPADVYQAMTGVDSRFRKRGLAKWLKASMYLRIREAFPENERFVTDMRAVNEPIQKINAAMGYTLQQQGIEFKINRDILKKYIHVK